MASKSETKERRQEQQPARKPHSGLAAKYGAIGSGAIRAALQFRKPATAKAK